MYRELPVESLGHCQSVGFQSCRHHLLSLLWNFGFTRSPGHDCAEDLQVRLLPMRNRSFTLAYGVMLGMAGSVVAQDNKEQQPSARQELGRRSGNASITVKKTGGLAHGSVARVIFSGLLVYLEAGRTVRLLARDNHQLLFWYRVQSRPVDMQMCHHQFRWRMGQPLRKRYVLIEAALEHLQEDQVGIALLACWPSYAIARVTGRALATAASVYGFPVTKTVFHFKSVPITRMPP